MNVIDLFAGVGGLSLGAARAGFDVKLAVEIDPQAIETHHLNFPNTQHLKQDVATLNASNIKKSLGNDVEVDGVIGGPPCQGFSSIGKGNPEDNRNQLYMHFFRIVDELRPKFFLAENVPGIMQEKYKHIREEALGHVKNNYYIFEPIKVRASDYGAPTIRTRIFFIGVRNDFKINCSEKIFLPDSITKTTVEEALFGLPQVIKDVWQNEEDGWQPINMSNEGPFYERLWGWVPNGVGDPESLNMLKNGIVSGFLGTVHSEIIKNRYSTLKFGETDRVSRSTRLDPKGFCPTLRAGTASDKGSYQAVRPIHPFDSRVITPREAARLQGFPDWFRFHGTKWHSFRQIGNSVSPIVGEFILKKLHTLLVKDCMQRGSESNHYSLEAGV